MRFSYLTLIIVMLVIGIAVASDLEKATLKGVSGFYVSVSVDAGNSPLRLRNAQVQDDVEMALRHAGVPVFVEGQLSADSLWNAATIHVTIDARTDTLHADKANPCLIAHYFLDVRQNARLERDTTVLAPTTTWRVSGIEVCLSKNATGAVRQALQAAAEGLIRDFREVNPRK